MKKLVYITGYSIISGILAYCISLIFSIIETVALNRMIECFIVVLSISILIFAVLQLFIFKHPSFVQMVINFLIMIMSYVVMILINAYIGTERYIYKLLNLNHEGYIGGTILVMCIVLAVGIITLAVVSAGKLIFKIMKL